MEPENKLIETEEVEYFMYNNKKYYLEFQDSNILTKLEEIKKNDDYLGDKINKRKITHSDAKLKVEGYFERKYLQGKKIYLYNNKAINILRPNIRHCYICLVDGDDNIREEIGNYIIFVIYSKIDEIKYRFEIYKANKIYRDYKPIQLMTIDIISEKVLWTCRTGSFNLHMCPFKYERSGINNKYFYEHNKEVFVKDVLIKRAVI
ncbi:hypothetical protein Hokovirus_4_5 [Hokovirus HKV1]|uniref:Uncharacterized protein n=1 Tax=Hokovirus HKV1 TaxID=1977638 RepID=A0A1V0SH93_9VIRU|nr:hypothetical protein Hokovirus_4_5 [Hokovirus HKV1]